MDNASRILLTLDGHLNGPARLVLYGRAAIHLGFTDPPRDVAVSKDVDAIVPLSDLDEISANDAFWDAQDATNTELRPQGLYITHLFRADQVFLRRDWEQHLVPMPRPATRWLRLFRPATLDLILTKMMRGDDPQDLAHRICLRPGGGHCSKGPADRCSTLGPLAFERGNHRRIGGGHPTP
jgi:hypothetical protein